MAKHLHINLRSRKILVVADKLLLLKAMRRLHGRFWGITGLFGLSLSIAICFSIRPELLTPEAAFSNFGEDPRTAPFFVGGILFSAYGLWRWRNYLTRTFKRPTVITTLITLTIVGLYFVAFMPVSWRPIASTVHYIGFTIAGLGIASTVLADILLRKTKRSKYRRTWQLVRVLSLTLIIEGAVITALSTSVYNILDSALVGESLMLVGYWIWVITKTYQGEGNRSKLSKIINKFVIVE